MPIQLTCKCGKKLSVPDDAVGRRARCPACNAVMPVPGTASEPPAPAPEPLRATDRVDDVINAFTEDLAKSRERAPEMTNIAKAMLVWAGVLFLLTFLGAVFAADGSLVLWIAVFVPEAAAAALLALGIIKAWRGTPAAVAFAAPVLIGANYVTFWMWANNVRGWGALYFIVSVVSLGGYAFLYWYFRQPGVASVFESVTVAEADASEPTKGSSAT